MGMRRTGVSLVLLALVAVPAVAAGPVYGTRDPAGDVAIAGSTATCDAPNVDIRDLFAYFDDTGGLRVELQVTDLANGRTCLLPATPIPTSDNLLETRYSIRLQHGTQLLTYIEMIRNTTECTHMLTALVGQECQTTFSSDGTTLRWVLSHSPAYFPLDGRTYTLVAAAQRNPIGTDLASFAPFTWNAEDAGGLLVDRATSSFRCSEITLRCV